MYEKASFTTHLNHINTLTDFSKFNSIVHASSLIKKRLTTMCHPNYHGIRQYYPMTRRSHWTH